MLTLETVVQQRLREFDTLKGQVPLFKRRVSEARAALSECDINTNPNSYFKAKDELAKAQVEYDKARTADEAQIEYLLNTTPFIRDYLKTNVDPDDASPRLGAQKHVLDNFVEVTGETRHNDVFHEYLKHVEGNNDPSVATMTKSGQRNQAMTKEKRATDSNNLELCVCGSRCVFDSRESMLVCGECGISKYHSYYSTQNLSYTEEINMNTVSSYSYKRLNHLSEWLSTLQAKQNTDIPEAVIEGVKNEFKKQRTLTRGEIKPEKVRIFLKKLGLSKYYEHCALITNMLNGVPPPQLPAELEAKIKSLFLQIQAPFQKHCPPTRSNFLSYSFVLHKLMILLGEDHYVVYFPLLKSTEKLWACEKIWKAICQELNWEYISS